MIVNYIEIGRRAAQRRKELKITQKIAANLGGISINQLSNIENNHSVPSIETVIKLCDVLKVTPDYLLLGIMRDSNNPLINSIAQSASLCTEKQRKLVYEFVLLLVNENY